VSGDHRVLPTLTSSLSTLVRPTGMMLMLMSMCLHQPSSFTSRHYVYAARTNAFPSVISLWATASSRAPETSSAHSPPPSSSSNPSRG
jgi:hypothetical protein